VAGTRDLEREPVRLPGLQASTEEASGWQGNAGLVFQRPVQIESGERWSVVLNRDRGDGHLDGEHRSGEREGVVKDGIVKVEVLRAEIKANHITLLSELKEANDAFFGNEHMLNNVLNVGCAKMAADAVA